MAIPAASKEEISGRHLYGDNFSSDQIREWYDSEVTGYFDLLSKHYKVTDADNQYNYEYDALNEFHAIGKRSEEHTSELQSPDHLVCRLLLEKKKNKQKEQSKKKTAHK